MLRQVGGETGMAGRVGPKLGPGGELCCAQLPSRDQLFLTLWVVAHQAPLSRGFFRHRYILQGIFLTLGSNLHLLCLLHCRQILFFFCRQILDLQSRQESKEKSDAVEGRWGRGEGAPLLGHWSCLCHLGSEDGQGWGLCGQLGNMIAALRGGPGGLSEWLGPHNSTSFS